MADQDFYERVYAVVKQIPQGRVTNYGAIAQYLGVASAARTVGYALNGLIKSEEQEWIPAHRVLNKQGELTGRHHFPGDSMRERLKQENVCFVDEYQVDMDQHFWNPMEELDAE